MAGICLTKGSVTVGIVFILCLTILVSGCTSQTVAGESVASPTTSGTSPPPVSPPATAPAEAPIPTRSTSTMTPVPTTLPIQTHTSATTTSTTTPSTTAHETMAPTSTPTKTPAPTTLPTTQPTTESIIDPTATPTPEWTEGYYRQLFPYRAFHYIKVDRTRGTARIIVECEFSAEPGEYDSAAYWCGIEGKAFYYGYNGERGRKVNTQYWTTMDGKKIIENETFDIEQLLFTFLCEDRMAYTLLDAGPPDEPFPEPPYWQSKLRVQYWPSAQPKYPPGPLHYLLKWQPMEAEQPTPPPFPDDNWTPGPGWYNPYLPAPTSPDWTPEPTPTPEGTPTPEPTPRITPTPAPTPGPTLPEYIPPEPYQTTNPAHLPRPTDGSTVIPVSPFVPTPTPDPTPEPIPTLPRYTPPAPDPIPENETKPA